MEENKVATRQSLHNVFENIGVKSDQAYRLADAILQSPDLRVTLAESRYFLRGIIDGSKPYIHQLMESADGGGAVAIAKFADWEKANDVCAWLNSKEPK